VFLTCILSKKLALDIQAVATTFQRLSKVFKKSTVVNKVSLSLFSYTQDFELMFVKKEFGVLLDHCQWNHTIELISGSEPKSSKIYSFLSTEQAEFNIFLLENFKTSHIYLS